MNGFATLRAEAERRGRLVKAASERRAPRKEACKLVASFGEAEIRMLNYVETNAMKCGIAEHFVAQLRTGQKKTEALQQKLCSAAPQVQRWPHEPVQVNDIGDPIMEHLNPFRPL